MFDKLQAAIRVFEDWSKDDAQRKIFEKLVNQLLDTYQSGGKLILAGNGGSSAEAAHIAAEFVGKCSQMSKPLPAISLSESSSQMTAISNDFGIESMFTRGIQAFAKEHDTVILLSTSGQSKNIISAANFCTQSNLKYSLWTSLKFISTDIKSDYTIVAPTFSTPRAQELHLVLGHILAEEIEIRYLV